MTLALRLFRRRSRRSLLAHILGVHAIGMAASAFFTLGAANVVLQLRTRLIEHRVLAGQANGILDGISMDGAGRLRIDYALTPLSALDRGLFVFTVVDAGGNVQLRSSDPAATRLARLRRPDHVRYLTLRRHGPTLAIITRPFAIGGKRLWLVVGWNLSAPGVIFDNVVGGYLWYSAGVTLVVLLALLGFDLAMVRGALRPMLRVIEAVRLSHRAGDEWRLSLDELPHEIVPLAGAYNEALDKVEAAYRLQRDFVADAAHELRTPLAVLRGRLETLPADPARALLLGDITVMTRIVSQLLEIASLEQLVVEHSVASDPAAVCATVIEALAPIAIASKRDLGLTAVPGGPPPRLRIRDQDLYQVLRNLVENAIHHTGEGVAIDVRVEVDGRIVVQDDGLGIPAELHAAVFERFWRRDRRDRSGAGLGLAIVRRIVATYGGSVTLASGDGNGCRFVVSLPVAVAPAAATAGLA